jgi:hypothetical protein
VIKEAIEKILDLGEIRTIEQAGRIYARDKDHLHVVVKPEEIEPAPLKVGTLESLVRYLVANPDGLDLDALTIHVLDPLEVRVIGPLQPENCNTRFTYLRACAGIGSFQFNKYMDLEAFVVGLQAGFVSSGEVAQIVAMLANLANEAIRQNKDDGFSQTLQVKTGLTTKAEVTVKNPVILAPFRTFREVEQPPGKFILRLKDHGNAAPLVALFSADLGAWELEAIKAIRIKLELMMEAKGIKVEVMS